MVSPAEEARRIESGDREPTLASELRPLAFLLGSWAGRGVGDYPTIDRFGYLEEVTFSHVGKPYLIYSQRTRSPSGDPLHTETGYWRIESEGAVEVVLAHPFGLVEISEGEVAGKRVVVHSRHTSATSTGAPVDAVQRTVWLDGDVLRYTVDMAASGQPLQRHLEAELSRVGRPNLA